ncbi:MAG: hypothetical protein AAGD14_14010 [Planctomycetota bacterium]
MSWRTKDYDIEEATPEDAWERARDKLEDIRSERVRLVPAGLFVGRVVGGILCGLIAAGLITFAITMLLDREPGTEIIAIVVGVPGLLMLIPTYRLTNGARANTPWRALNLFYRQLAGGKYANARKLVVPSDFDHFPRFYPRVDKVRGFPLADPSLFEDPVHFQSYWKSLMRWPTSPYCIVRVFDLKTEEVAPDLMHCTFKLRLGVNTSLWALLIFVPPGLIFAVIVDAISRTNIHVQLSKNLVRVEDEWHVLNAAWQEPDDKIADWVSRR